MILCLQDSWTTSLNYDTAATTIPIRIDLTTPQAVCRLQATFCIIEICDVMKYLYLLHML